MTQLKATSHWTALYFVPKSSCVPTCAQSRLGRFSWVHLSRFAYFRGDHEYR
ncbi:MAG: hypothetical protein IPK82_20510 [Polyangiaceae bacterium]|nr:hypothetical protein [Polyangiaceae bacterium]